jgi:hypothetical protein
MGANQSIESGDVNFSYHVDDIENNVNNIGTYSLVSDVKDYVSPKKILVDLDSIINLFKTAYNDNMDICAHYIKLNNIQYNYKIKNQVIVDDLQKKIMEQDIYIKNRGSESFQDIELSKNYRTYIRSKESTKKILLIFIFIIVLLFVSIGLLFGKRRLDTGRFTTN